MNDLVSEEAREWIGKSDDPIEIEVTRRDIIKYSVATEQLLDKFTNGNKGTSISDCFIYMENDRGGLNELGRIELQESRLIGKINSSAAWRVVLKKDRKTTRLQSTTFKI